jgi:predicted Fe-Mo cluster-binding NifX family protein
MKQIAIPITYGKLSEYFGQCNHYKIFEIRENRVISRLLKVPDEIEITSMPLWASEQGITDIITYKIDRRIMHLFAKYKINLYIGIKYTSPEEIITNYLNGKLNSDERIITEIKNINYERD